MTTNPPILAAEDEETDALFLRMSVEEAGVRNPLVIAPDGQSAVDYLVGAPPYSDRLHYPLPGLLLLDLKMPRMDGFGVLAWLAERPEFQTLPVVVLSSSADDADMNRARQMGARDYFVKPHDFRRLRGIIREVVQRWLVESPACSVGAADTRSQPLLGKRAA